MGPINLKIGDLLLDLENPRIIAAKNQRDALQKIVDDQGDKLLALARSIVEDEGMNPTDTLLVLKESDGYVVLEGNRRLAALRILDLPSRLDDISAPAPLRKSFSRLAERFDRDSVEPIRCYEIKNRQLGVKWLHQRHTGENGGKGVVAWSGLAASRFRGENPALQALAFVMDHGDLTPEQARLASDQFPITTLERLLSSREVRQRLGFDVKGGKLVSGLPAQSLLTMLRQLVLDLAEGRTNVSLLKNSADQIKYVEKFFAKASRPDLSEQGQVRPVEDVGAADFAPSKTKPSSQPQKARPKAPPKRPVATERRTLVPKTCGLVITAARISAIFKELSRLRVEDAPNAVAVLFRVFLELSIDHYMTKTGLALTAIAKGGRKVDKSLKAKVREVIDHLVASGKNAKDFRSVSRALDDVRSPLSTELLNDYVHNRFTTPKTRDLLSSWDDAQPFFEGLWE